MGSGRKQPEAMKYCAEASFEDRTFENNIVGKMKPGRSSHLNNTGEF